MDTLVLCETACSVDLPTSITTSCNIVTRAGGLDKVFFTACDFVVTPANSITKAFWAAAIASGDAVASNLLSGEKGDDDITETKVTSRLPSTQSQRTINWTFKDYGRYDVNGLILEAADIKFWNKIQLNSAAYRTWILTSSEHLHGPFQSSVTASENVETDIKGYSFINGKISYNHLGMSEGAKVVGFYAL